RCARGLAQVTGEVSRRLERMTAPDLALRQIEQHRRVMLQRIRLEERGSRLLESLLIEELHALLEPAPRHLGDGIFLLRESDGRCDGETRGSKQKGGETGACSHRSSEWGVAARASRAGARRIAG